MENGEPVIGCARVAIFLNRAGKCPRESCHWTPRTSDPFREARIREIHNSLWPRIDRLLGTYQCLGERYHAISRPLRDSCSHDMNVYEMARKEFQAVEDKHDPWHMSIAGDVPKYFRDADTLLHAAVNMKLNTRARMRLLSQAKTGIEYIDEELDNLNETIELMEAAYEGEVGSDTERETNLADWADWKTCLLTCLGPDNVGRQRDPGLPNVIPTVPFDGCPDVDQTSSSEDDDDDYDDAAFYAAMNALTA